MSSRNFQSLCREMCPSENITVSILKHNFNFRGGETWLGFKGWKRSLGKKNYSKNSNGMGCVTNGVEKGTSLLQRTNKLLLLKERILTRGLRRGRLVKGSDPPIYRHEILDSGPLTSSSQSCFYFFNVVSSG